MRAVVSATETRQLDRRTESDELVTEQDTQDAPKLAKLLVRILREIATLKRQWSPRVIDFEDVAVDATGTKRFQLHHGFGAKVRCYPVGWSGAAAPNITQHDDTTLDTLVVVSTSAGVATIRVEEAG